MVDVDDYRTHLTCGLSECWRIASENVKIAQSRQKKFYDRNAKQKSILVGDRVTPQEATGKNWKLARAFHGPFRVLSVTPTNVEARLVDKPDHPSIFVSRSRVRQCYEELADVSWSGHDSVRKRGKVKTQSPTVRDTTVESENRPLTRLQAQRLARS